jgi:hypothetical protein
MSEVIVPDAEAAGAQAQYDPRSAFKSVAVSLLVNAVAPYAVYRLLAPHYPAISIIPLLYASAFPILGLIVGFLRTRVIDAIAAFALFGLAYSLVTTVLAGEVHLALIIGATQGFLIAAFFFVSALVKRPILFFVARQFIAGNSPERRARFAAVNELDRGRTFFTVTMFWAGGILSLSLLSLGLAFVLVPATYILVNNILNIAVNLVLVALTVRVMRRRLEPLADQLPPAGPELRPAGPEK